MAQAGGSVPESMYATRPDLLAIPHHDPPAHMTQHRNISTHTHLTPTRSHASHPLSRAGARRTQYRSYVYSLSAHIHFMRISILARVRRVLPFLHLYPELHKFAHTR